MNQLFKLLEKEIGNVASINIRRVPVPKDGDAQDALDIWEMEARNRGIIFDDDSPENTKAPVSNTSIAKNIDLTRSNEIQSRYNLAQQMKNECWELVGLSKQRLGSVSASESATGTNTAVQQSYSQTEPLFVAHEYVLGQLYQAIIDAAQYIESSKPSSTISYVTDEGENAFISINGTDLKFRDLKVFPTNRPEDTQMFNEIRQLSQAVIQNGGTLYDVIELYSTKSIREMKKTFKELRDKMIEQQQTAQQQQQQQIDQQQKQSEALLEQNQAIAEQKMENDNYQKELDRLSKEKIAIIQATGFGKVESEDTNQNNVPDVLEIGKLAAEETNATRTHIAKMAEITQKARAAQQKLDIEKEKLKNERLNMANDLAVAKMNAKGRANKKSK